MKTAGLTIETIMGRAHETAKAKGWWDKDKQSSVGEFIANAHGELSEAFEIYRDNGSLHFIGMDGDKPEGFAVELADVILRIADFCQAHSIPLEAALKRKMGYNDTRAYRHGGKRV